MQDIGIDLLRRIFGFFDVGGQELYRSAYVNRRWKSAANIQNQKYKVDFKNRFAEIFEVSLSKPHKERDWRKELYWACRFANAFPTSFNQIRHRRYYVDAWQVEFEARSNNSNAFGSHIMYNFKTLLSSENKDFYQSIAECNIAKLLLFKEKAKLDATFRLTQLLDHWYVLKESLFSADRPCDSDMPEEADKMRSIIWDWVCEEENVAEELFNPNRLLELAVITHQPESILDRIVARGAVINNAACVSAVKVNNLKAVKFFVSKQPYTADDFHVFLKNACDAAHFDIVKYFLGDKKVKKMMQDTAIPGNTDWHYYCDSIMFFTCENLYPELIRFLAEQFVLSDELWYGDRDVDKEEAGETIAMLHGVCRRDDGRPLHNNEYFGDDIDLYCAKILIEELEVNEVNPIGYDDSTPLHLACMGENYNLVEYLLEKGAAIDKYDTSGNTPLKYLNYNVKLSEEWLLQKRGNLIFRVVFFRNKFNADPYKMPADHKKLYLQNCVENISSLDEKESIEFWKKVGEIYQTKIVPLCQDDSELLLCCAIITRQDLKEIERIIQYLKVPCKPSTIELANKYSVPLESLPSREIDDIFDFEVAGYDSDNKRPFDP